MLPQSCLCRELLEGGRTGRAANSWPGAAFTARPAALAARSAARGHGRKVRFSNIG